MKPARLRLDEATAAVMARMTDAQLDALIAAGPELDAWWQARTESELEQMVRTNAKPTHLTD